MSRQHTYPLLLALCLLALTSAPAAAEGGPHRAALVVRFPDGNIQKRCVTFTEASISGEKLLQDSGLTVIMNYNVGGAVCSIAGQGCAYPREDCFCRCQGVQGVQCEYWAYYHWTGGGWQYSQVGASSYQVSDGALEGWSWGPGNFSVGTLPPMVTYDEICTPPTSTPTATPTRTTTPTATPSPTATATPSGAAARTTFLPQISFEVTANSLTPGACAVLKWVTWDADRVTLNGAAVIAQDRQEVCPTTPQRYVLIASNAAGQVTREIAIAVTTDDRRPTTTGDRLATTTPSAVPVATATPTPAPVATATPQPVLGSLGLAQAVQAQAAPTEPVLPLAPERVEGIPRAGARVAAATLQPPPTATPASPSRRSTDSGQATPTPILLAFAPASTGGGLSSAPSANSTGQSAAPSAPDRRFRLALLPGYGAYLLTAGLLLAVGIVVTRRRTVRAA
ncbi:MAG: hypothetical protein NT169_11610 [Chloroflexi bacterium]|nr:hypothetical protein [Chloroflexota bacterium]